MTDRAVAPSLLSALSDASEGALETSGARRGVPRGAILIRRGEPAGEMFFVLRGRMEVRVDGRVVAEIAAHQPVGEIAFLTGGTRSADVVAARDSEVLALDRSTFDALVARMPELGAVLTAWLARRLGEVTTRISVLPRPEPRALCLMGAGDGALPGPLVVGLRAALGAHGRLRVVDAADGDAPRGGDDALGAALLDGERAAERSLYVARDDDPLGRAMVRQSDAVIVAGPLGRPAAPAGLERYAEALHEAPARRLVLWREGEAIAGTRAWLDARAVRQHHHLRLDDPAARDADLARVARFAAGRARGVVLGGGGALGCAHLGVARALREAGVAVDLWGGTSVGGAMAVALATGLDPAEAMERCHDIFVANAALGRLAPPVYGLLDAHAFDRELRRHYGETDLTDLPIPVFAASTSLTRNDLRVHRDGPSWEAVRASGSLPLMLPPFIDAEGEVLIDGALIDNLPLGAMRDLKAGPNLVVTLTPDREYRARAPYSDLPTRLATLGHMITRRRTGVPRLAGVLSRAMIVSSRREMARTDLGDDVMLRPPAVPGMSLMDWRRGSEQEALAHAHARAALEGGALAAFRA